MTRVVMVVCAFALACDVGCAEQASTDALPRQPWGRALVSAHVTADDAIDAGNLEAARTALGAGLAIDAPAPARQDLLQRLAWVELKLGLVNEAREHADQALTFIEHDRGSQANALVVRHLIAVRAGDQPTVDALTEQLLEALAPR